MADELFLVIVDLALKSSASEKEVRLLLAQNASASLREEPGCLRFDVVKIKDNGGFLLYEIYKNSQSFSNHLETPHYKEFSKLAKRHLSKIDIRFGDLLKANADDAKEER